MSFTTKTTVNSGPLIIRTALDDSLHNTYLLGPYEQPVASNYVLMTSTNGLLVPSRDVSLNNALIASTVSAAEGHFTTVRTAALSTTTVSTVSLSTLTASSGTVVTSSLHTQEVVTSSLYSNGCTLENGTLRYTVLTKQVSTGTNYLLNSTDWWGKYIFVTNTTNDVNLSLPLTSPLPPDGTIMHIVNAASGRATIINNLVPADRTVTYPAAAQVIYNAALNRWYSLS